MKIKKSKKIFLVIFFIVLAFILISCKDNKINIILPIESTEENETTNDISEPETEENIDITEETDGETTEDLSEEDSTETTEKTVVNKEPKRYFNFLNGSE